MTSSEQSTKIVQSSTLVLAFTVLGMGVKYVFISFATKIFPRSAFGQYSLAVSLTTLIGITGILGLHLAEDRFIPIYRSNGELGKVRYFISILFPVVFTVTATLSMLLFIFAEEVALLFGSPSLVSVLQPFSIAIVGMAMLDLTTYAYRGFEQPRYQAVFRRFGLSFSTLIICSVAYLFEMGITSLYIAYPISVILLAIVILILFYTQIFSTLPNSQPIDIRKIFDYSWPYSFSKAASVFLVYADILFVGYFLTAKDVAIYQVVVALTAPILLPIRSLVPMYKPICSKQIAAGKTELSSIYNLIIRLSLIFGGILIIMYAVVGPEILSVVSTTEYQSGGNALIVLALGNGIVLFFGPTGPTLQATDNSWFFLKVSLAKLIGNVFLNILLIPIYGLVGAAIATASSKFLGELLIYSHIRNVASVDIELAQMWRLGAVFGLTYMLSTLAHQTIPVAGYVGTLLSVAIAVVLYITCTCVIAVTEEDIVLAQKLIPVRITDKVKDIGSSLFYQ